jgi:hypothetical protein
MRADTVRAIAAKCRVQLLGEFLALTGRRMPSCEALPTALQAVPPL